MALTQIELVDLIEVIAATGALQVRTRKAIFDEDTGKEVAASFHRHVVMPGDDLTGQAVMVKNMAAVVHTPEVIAAHQAAQAKAQAAQNAHRP